jgi:branched-chain amino acid transport system substrate-binding protein
MMQGQTAFLRRAEFGGSPSRGAARRWAWLGQAWLRQAALGGAAALASLASVAPAKADIVIGLAVPISGANATVGGQLRTGAETAVEDVNARGGVLGQKLVLTEEDDECDAMRAVDVASKLVAESVNFVLGHFCSAATLPASSMYADNGTVEITFSSNSKITEQGFDGLFRIAGRDDRQGELLADFIAQHDAGKSVALVADRSPYAAGLTTALRDMLWQSGAVLPVLDAGVDAGSKDFDPLIQSLKASNADVVVYIGYATEAALIMKGAAAAGIKPEFISTNNAANPALWDIAGPSAEGLLFSFLPAAELMPSAHDVVQHMQAKGKKVDGYTLYAYAAVQLFAQALDRAKEAKPEPVAIELQKGGFQTVLGDLSFDDKGDNTLPSWRMYQWHAGSYGYYGTDTQ